MKLIAAAAAAVTAAAVVTLGVTGVLLADRYRPEGGAPFGEQPSFVRSNATLHDWHLAAAYIAIAAAVVALAAALAAWDGGGRRLLVGGAIGAIAVLVAAFLTGDLLAWDQLGLFAVTVGGEGYDGIWKAAFDDGVRFIIKGGTEVGQGDYRVAVIVHALALPVLLLAAAAVAGAGVRRLARRGPTPPAARSQPTGSTGASRLT